MVVSVMNLILLYKKKKKKNEDIKLYLIYW